VTTDRGTWFHGSPWSGLRDDLSNWQHGHLFLTRERAVAERYAAGQMLGAAHRVPPGTVIEPTVYEIALPPLRILDAQKPEHRALYEEWAQRSRALDRDDWWPRLASATNTTTGQWEYSLRIPLLTQLAGAGWDGALFDESTQGVSLGLVRPVGEVVARRALQQQNPTRQTEIHVFDFDGTLFASPEKPSWWSGGWWGKPESLGPPCVPTDPGPEWWNDPVVEAARQAIASPDVYAILATGRLKAKFSERVPYLLRQAGLSFDEVALEPGFGSTLEFKLHLLDGLLGSMPEVRHVEIWEDRPEHVAEFERFLRERGLSQRVHTVPRVAGEPLCRPPKSALQSRYKAVSIKLDKQSKQLLLQWVPASHAQVFADHVTVLFEPRDEQISELAEGEPAFVKLIAHVEDDRGQAVAVIIPDFLAELANRMPHITISTAKGTPPAYSNELLEAQTWSRAPALILMGRVHIE